MKMFGVPVFLVKSCIMKFWGTAKQMTEFINIQNGVFVITRHMTNFSFSTET